MYLNITKAIYGKSIANVLLNGKILKSFLIKSGMRQECPVSPLLFHKALELLARAMR
jgi:hypothetical protein